MVFILLGVLLLALKVAGVDPVTDWSWLWVLAPFPCAIAWWVWSDMSGRTRRVAMRKDQAHKQERRRNLAQGMGLHGLFDRGVSAKLRKAEAKSQAARQRQETPAPAAGRVRLHERPVGEHRHAVDADLGQCVACGRDTPPALGHG